MPPKKGASSKGNAASGSESHEYNVGDTVLCRVKGYPDWPGKVGGSGFSFPGVCSLGARIEIMEANKNDDADPFNTSLSPLQLVEHDTAPAAVRKSKGNKSLLVRFFGDTGDLWVYIQFGMRLSLSHTPHRLNLIADLWLIICIQQCLGNLEGSKTTLHEDHWSLLIRYW